MSKTSNRTERRVWMKADPDGVVRYTLRDWKNAVARLRIRELIDER